MQISNNLVVVDVETTGPNPFVHDLLSIAFVPVRYPEKSLSIYVRTVPMSWSDFGRSNFKRFQDDWNRLAVSPAEAVRQIEWYLADLIPNEAATLVGHNVGFDVSFLKKLAHLAGLVQLPRISHRSVDTHTLLYLAAQQHAIPIDAVSSDAAFELLKISPPLPERHTALGDAMATRFLFLRLLDLLDPRASETFRRVAR